MDPSVSLPGEASEPEHARDISGWWHAATRTAPCSEGTWWHKSPRPARAVSDAKLSLYPGEHTVSRRSANAHLGKERTRVDVWGGLTVVGCQVPTQPLAHPLSSAKQGENKREKLMGWEAGIKAARNEAPNHASWFEEAMTGVSWPQRILPERRAPEEQRSLGVWLRHEDTELKPGLSLPLLRATCITRRSVPR